MWFGEQEDLGNEFGMFVEALGGTVAPGKPGLCNVMMVHPEFRESDSKFYVEPKHVSAARSMGIQVVDHQWVMQCLYVQRRLNRGPYLQ